jgi:hypothetical protein
MTTLVYILAASHSGSTLTAMLLGAHPEVATVGELKATSLGEVNRYRCSCGTLIRQCSFWQRVSTEMESRGHVFDITQANTNVVGVNSRYAQRLLRPLHRGAVAEGIRDALLKLSRVWRDHLREIQGRNVALIETVSAVTGARLIVDSSKIGLRLKYLLRLSGLEIRVIRLIRDGRGVALTYLRPGEFADATNDALRGGGSGLGHGSAAQGLRNMRAAAREWRRSNEEAEALLATLSPSQSLEVRYEELCVNPSRTLRTICSFLGIDPAQLVLDFRSVEQHVVGNGMRLDDTSDIRLDERWRAALNETELREFDAVAGRLNRRYGYR